MKSIDKILTDYCGCFGHPFNDITGELTDSGKTAYEYLKKFISDLSAIGVLDLAKTADQLDKIIADNVVKESSIDEETEKWLSVLTKHTLGRKLMSYSSWNGSSENIVVEEIQIIKNSPLSKKPDIALFIGRNHWGNKSGIYINLQCINDLLNCGNACKHEEIDHCDVVTRWSLN